MQRKKHHLPHQCTITNELSICARCLSTYVCTAGGGNYFDVDNDRRCSSGRFWCTIKPRLEKMRQLIWKNRHQLIEKNKLYPCSTRGRMRFDVGRSNLIAQRVRPVALAFWEKLADLIMGLLSSRITRPSTSPSASHSSRDHNVNGEDIRPCIYYRRVNQPTRLILPHASYQRDVA